MIPQDKQEEGGSWLAAGGPEGTRSHRVFLHVFWGGSFGLFLMLQGYALWAGHNPPMRLAFNGVFLACALVVLLIMGPSGMLLAAGHEWRLRRRQRGSTT